MQTSSYLSSCLKTPSAFELLPKIHYTETPEIARGAKGKANELKVRDFRQQQMCSLIIYRQITKRCSFIPK